MGDVIFNDMLSHAFAVQSTHNVIVMECRIVERGDSKIYAFVSL